MAITLDKLHARKEEILEIAAQYSAENVRVFGSVGRNEADEDSDVDLLVTFLSGASLFDQIGLMQHLAKTLGVKVDVVSDRALNRHLRDRVLNEAQPL